MNTVFELREKFHMTQDEFAEFCGISRISIARYEAGAKVSRANAEKISDACKVSVSYVIGDSNSWRNLPPEIKKLVSAEHPVPDILDFGASTTNPAMLGGMNDAVMRLFDEASDLSPDEADQARAFVLGLKANRKPGPVPPPSDQK